MKFPETYDCSQCQDILDPLKVKITECALETCKAVHCEPCAEEYMETCTCYDRLVCREHLTRGVCRECNEDEEIGITRLEKKIRKLQKKVVTTGNAKDLHNYLEARKELI